MSRNIEIDMAVLTLGSGAVTSFPAGSGVGGRGKGAGGGSGPSVTYGDSLDSDDPFYYWKDGVKYPHVIYIDGDATFKNTTYHGIYIVNGSIDQQGGWTDINGVVLVLDPDGTYTLKGTHGGRYHVTGGIVSYGEIVGNGHPEVQHKYEYMDVFTKCAQEDLSKYHFQYCIVISRIGFHGSSFVYCCCGLLQPTSSVAGESKPPAQNTV